MIIHSVILVSSTHVLSPLCPLSATHWQDWEKCFSHVYQDLTHTHTRAETRRDTHSNIVSDGGLIASLHDSQANYTSNRLISWFTGLSYSISFSSEETRPHNTWHTHTQVHTHWFTILYTHHIRSRVSLLQANTHTEHTHTHTHTHCRNAEMNRLILFLSNTKDDFRSTENFLLSQQF